jgi:hypothetical protein
VDGIANAPTPNEQSERDGRLMQKK